MGQLRVGVVGFDITPRIDPQYGAWGTTPSMTQIDMPLLARCIALEQDGRRLIWFGSDLTGEGVSDTIRRRDAVAEALGLSREQIIWSTSQTHAAGGLPESRAHAGSAITKIVQRNPEFVEAEGRRFINAYIEAAREAIAKLQPARVRAGRGFCDSISYNSRFPMPTGGVKFSRHQGEAVQGGKFFDTTIGLVRFDDQQGRPLGAIFNFTCHPATIIMDKWVSPDYVGTARQYVEEAIGGAPAMFIQGFCGDVHNYHMFGTPDHAKRTGARLGKAAAEAMGTVIPALGEPLAWSFKTIQIQCQPPPSPDRIRAQIAERLAFIEELKHDPAATWICGINLPEAFTPDQKAAMLRVHIDYYEELARMLQRGQPPRETLDVPLGAVQMGDVGAALSPGENFTLTSQWIRNRSPFVHTLICGDTNGLFGYIGTDDEIDRRGFETDTYWSMIYHEGVRLPPAKGSAQRVADTCVELLRGLRNGRP